MAPGAAQLGERAPPAICRAGGVAGAPGHRLELALAGGHEVEVESRQLAEGNPNALVRRLAAGEIDLAVVSDAEGWLHGGDDVELEHLMDDPLHVALPADHPLVDAPAVRMADLREETWIEGRDSVCAGPLRAAARAAGFEPRIGFEAEQWLGKQGLVAAGVGVTLIPTVALATVRDDVVLRSLGDEAPARRLFLASQACGYRAPAVEPMTAILRRVAEEHCFTCAARLTARAAA